MGCAAKTRMQMPTTDPTAETSAELVNAIPARPCLAMGKPSNVVAIDAGVPGVLMRIAGTRSPNCAAT